MSPANTTRFADPDQSSFTPYTCEIVYQALLPTSPAPTDPKQDVRSIHFLPFPAVRQEYFDPVIERQVKRLKTVIELGRGIRDKHILKVKVSQELNYPLKSNVLT